MYGAELEPMISEYAWFSITIVKMWSKVGTVLEVSASFGPNTYVPTVSRNTDAQRKTAAVRNR